MAYATTRNKALRDEWRLMTATDSAGAEWYVPDGHFAIQFPIYDGYKIKKSQEARDGINIQPVLDGMSDVAWTKGYFGAVVEDKDGVTCQIISAAHDHRTYEWVDKRYYDLFYELYPNAEYQLDQRGETRFINVITEDGERVGLIAPRKDKYTLNERKNTENND